MKKKHFGESYSHFSINFRKLLTIMKLTILLMCVLTFNVSGSVYSQNSRLSLEVKDKSIREVLKTIEKQSQFRFFYNDEFTDLSKAVSLTVNNLPISEILSQVFDETQVTFKVLENNFVVITPMLVKQQKITGTVTDATTGEPIIGANVIIGGSTIGVVTDVLGKFSLDIPNPDAILIVSYLGYNTVKVSINGQSVFDIKLISDVTKLDEVVVVGYGTQSKREISGSVTNLKSKDFNKGLATSAADLLQGKVAGLVITKGNGDITGLDKDGKETTSIRLRGTSSLTGSSAPFVVIDGVPGGDINTVAPQDIEAITILKDASSAAIYGSRSASGVILITTKKGSATNTRVSYEGYVAIDQVTNIPKMVTGDEWRQYAIENKKDITGMDLGANTDWFGEIMRTGVTQNHNLSLSGGAENHNYSASVAYMDQQGVVKGNDRQRTNSRFSFSQRAINNKLMLSFTGNAIMEENHPTDPRSFILAYNTIPVKPVKLDNGDWYESRDFDQGNPVHNIELNTRKNQYQDFYGNFRADFEVIKGLKLSASAFQQRKANDWTLYNNSNTEAGFTALGYAERKTKVWMRSLYEYTANYNTTINGVHHIGALAGYSWERNDYQYHGANNRQFGTNLLGADNLQSGENLLPADVTSNRNMYKMISFFGRLTYNFSEKYVLAGTMRRDGSSKFGANNKWGIFPSFSAAWNVSKEGFLNSVSLINDLKVRVGYGVTGNQESIDPYRSLNLYGSKDIGQYYNDGKWYTAYGVTQNANPDLKWEKSAMSNIGIDFSIMENRISGTLEYYKKVTSDLLYEYNVPVPPYQFKTLLANVGTMENKGVEVLLNVVPIRTKDFQWTVNFNLAHNKNILTKLQNDQFKSGAIKSGSAFIRGGSDTKTHILEEGQPVGTFWGYHCEGLDEKGKYIFTDQNGDGKIDDKDETHLGSAQAKLTYGINSTFNYKNWDLSFFLRGVYGNKVLNYSRMSFATTQWLMGANVLEEALTNGLKDAPVYSDYYIEDGSFLRLENLSLGYTFKTEKIRWVKNMRVYVVGQNLFLITKYKGLDPEVRMDGLQPGVEGRDFYPKSRTFVMGVNISF